MFETCFGSASCAPMRFDVCTKSKFATFCHWSKGSSICVGNSNLTSFSCASVPLSVGFECAGIKGCSYNFAPLLLFWFGFGLACCGITLLLSIAYCNGALSLLCAKPPESTTFIKKYSTSSKNGSGHRNISFYVVLQGADGSEIAHRVCCCTYLDYCRPYYVFPTKNRCCSRCPKVCV